VASNRFRENERGTTLATLSQALNALARRAARVQIAYCGAAAMTFTGWAANALQRAAADRADTRVARAWTNN
jgi:uncharacterized protein YukE